MGLDSSETAKFCHLRPILCILYCNYFDLFIIPRYLLLLINDFLQVLIESFLINSIAELLPFQPEL